MKKKTVAGPGTNTKLSGKEEKDWNEDMLEGIEIDVLDLLDGKMNRVAMEHLHKQICGKSGF